MKDQIIEYEGKRFVRTGERKTPEAGDHFIAMRNCGGAQWEYCKPLQIIKAHTRWESAYPLREIVREIPAESPWSKQSEAISVGTLPPIEVEVAGVLVSDGPPGSGRFGKGTILPSRSANNAPQPREAVRELAQKLSGKWDENETSRLITEALAPLMEKAWNIVLNAKLIPDPRMKGATDCYAVPPEDVTDIESELTRWQERKAKP